MFTRSYDPNQFSDKHTTMCRHMLNCMQTHKQVAQHARPQWCIHILLTEPIYCMWGPWGVLDHLVVLKILGWSSVTFKIMPVPRLKHSGTNDSNKGMPPLWAAWSPSNPEGERQDGKREREGDGKLEREMVRLRENGRCNIKQIDFKILHTRACCKSCKNSHWQKAVICLVYERGNNTDTGRALSLANGGCTRRNGTRVTKKGGHTSFLEGQCADKDWMSLAEVGRPLWCRLWSASF